MKIYKIYNLWLETSKFIEIFGDISNIEMTHLEDDYSKEEDVSELLIT